MTRNGHRLSKAEQKGYWLSLCDQLEREVTEYPEDKQLEPAIVNLEERLGGVPNGEERIKVALANARVGS
jgi:predicted house-cleaning noncanonical NTP pyrophosphatase (MazG superfamily)